MNSVSVTSTTRNDRRIARALWVNAGLLLAIFLGLLAINGGSKTASILAAQSVPEMYPPIAGGAGLFMMPAQFSREQWGCYLMDIDTQTLVTYEYREPAPGQHPMLNLSSARNFRFDRRLSNFNTTPDPREVARMLEKEAASDRVLKSRPLPHPDPEISPETD